MQINMTINNRPFTINCDPGEFLLDTLRDNGFLSVKRGCETGSCGLCTVWLDDVPVLSCALLTARAGGRKITTIEALQSEAEAFAQFMVAEGAEQCGFCAPGFTMTVLAMKRELENPTEESINAYLAGNLCRCSGYMGQMRALLKFMDVPSKETVK